MSSNFLEKEVQVGNLWLLESVAYQLSHNFVSSLSEDSCSSCMFRWLSVWEHLINLLPNAMLDCRLFNWTVLTKLVACSYSSRELSILETVAGLIEEQRATWRIPDDVSTLVLQFLHTLITIYYFNEQNIRKARKHMQKHDVLNKEQLADLLNNEVNGAFPAELDVKNLQKYIVPYVQAMVDKLGRPRIFDIISTCSNGIENTATMAHRERLDTIVLNHINANTQQSSDTEEAADGALCDVVAEVNCNEVSSSGDFATANTELSQNTLSSPPPSPVYERNPICNNKVGQSSTNAGRSILLTSEATPKHSRSKHNFNTASIDETIDADAYEACSEQTKHLNNANMIQPEDTGQESKTLINGVAVEDELVVNNTFSESGTSKHADNTKECTTNNKKKYDGVKLKDLSICIVTTPENVSTSIDFTNYGAYNGTPHASNNDESTAKAVSSQVSTISSEDGMVKKDEKVILKDAQVHNTDVSTVPSPVSKRKRFTRKASKIVSPYNIDSGESVTWTSDEDESTMPCQLGSYSMRNKERGQEYKKKKTGGKVKFSAIEEQYVIDGVKICGFGNWKQILTMYDFHESRTNISIKDKYRTLVKQGIIKEK